MLHEAREQRRRQASGVGVDFDELVFEVARIAISCGRPGCSVASPPMNCTARQPMSAASLSSRLKSAVLSKSARSGWGPDSA